MKKTSSLLVLLILITKGIFAQDYQHKNQIKAGLYTQLFEGMSLAAPYNNFYALEYNYQVYKGLSVGGLFGYSNSMAFNFNRNEFYDEDQYTVGFNANLKPLDYVSFLKADRRLDVYIATKYWLTFLSPASIYRGRSVRSYDEFFLGLGTNWYFTKNVGIYFEYDLINHWDDRPFRKYLFGVSVRF